MMVDATELTFHPIKCLRNLKNNLTIEGYAHEPLSNDSSRWTRRRVVLLG